MENSACMKSHKLSHQNKRRQLFVTLVVFFTTFFLTFRVVIGHVNASRRVASSNGSKYRRESSTAAGMSPEQSP